MSARVKIPLLLAFVFLVNGVILYAYLNGYFLHLIAEKISEISGYPFTAEMLLANEMGDGLVAFEIAIFVSLLIFAGIVVYYTFARRLTQLTLAVRQYGKGTTVSRSNRRDEIASLQNSFADLTKQLDEEQKAQDRMIASISHDIKTPLTSILGYSENLIKKELPPERIRQYLEIIYRAAQDVDSIVGEFDDYLKGKLNSDVRKRRVTLSYIEKMLVEEYRDELSQKGIMFEVRNERGTESLAVDLLKIRRLFANLIGNCMRHNQHVERLSITVVMSASGEKTLFTVTDNGVGMDAQALDHAFEPFFTTDSGRTLSGLGLSMCKSIVENHGGEIWINREHRQGMQVCFTM